MNEEAVEGSQQKRVRIQWPVKGQFLREQSGEIRALSEPTEVQGGQKVFCFHLLF